MITTGNLPGVSEAFQNASAQSKSRQRRNRPAPFSLRLTHEERSRLEYDAGDQPIGAYIRSKLFDGAQPRQRRRQKRPVKDHQALGKLLGELGKSRLANNLNQLAKAANSGSLPVTSDTQKALNDACADIRWLRQSLMEALGLQP